MNIPTSIARNETNRSGFDAGIARSKPASDGDSKAQSAYRTSPSEPTVRPIQKGQTDIHYDAQSSRPVIPISQNTQVSQSLRDGAGQSGR